MRRLVIMIVAVIVVIGMLDVNALANEPIYTDKADRLNELGLFAGTNKGYELDRAPKRVESAVMLIRLLGVENEVLEGVYSHPFLDVPTWADKYIGYMWENGLTKGISENQFGSEQLTDIRGYSTFVLRALGYDDSIGEFTWAKSVDVAVEKGLLFNSEQERLVDEEFLRGDMVNISYNALGININSTSIKLIEELVSKGAVNETVAVEQNLIDIKSNVLPYSVGVSPDDSIVIKGDDIMEVFPDAKYVLESYKRLGYEELDEVIISAYKYIKYIEAGIGHEILEENLLTKSKYEDLDWITIIYDDNFNRLGYFINDKEALDGFVEVVETVELYEISYVNNLIPKIENALNTRFNAKAFDITDSLGEYWNVSFIGELDMKMLGERFEEAAYIFEGGLTTIPNENQLIYFLIKEYEHSLEKDDLKFNDLYRHGTASYLFTKMGYGFRIIVLFDAELNALGYTYFTKGYNGNIVEYID